MSRAPARGTAEINRRLGGSIRGSPARLYAAAGHLVYSGGKRLRPYMVLKSCQMLGGKKADAIPAAVAVEMIHNFTLVHDDIMDNDEMRHGVQTVHKKFGLPVAILAGDVLFSKAYRVISDAGLPPDVAVGLVSRLAGACVDVCEGQLYDIEMARSTRIPGQAQYIKMIRKKTAALFGASCEMGAICAGAGRRDAGRLSSFGDSLGIAFQITDDLIGVMGDPKVTKKPVGNDLREGKKSLPILMAIKRARGADRKAILGSFGNAGASAAGLGEAVRAMRGMGIEDSVRKMALGYADRAARSLDGYSGPARDELAALLGFVVGRSR